MKNLESLNLSFTLVTDSGLKRLSGLTSLKSLNLDARQISDAGLAAITSKDFCVFLSCRGKILAICVENLVIDALISTEINHVLEFF